MPSWKEFVEQLEGLPDSRATFFRQELEKYLNKISERRKGRNVIFYASAFLQKPQAPQTHLQITHEDLNGFMSTLYGMDWTKGLTLLLHTPGGLPNAAQSIVEYLHQKFGYIEVIVPVMAMSAGTMISLAANRIIMGRQSQLGPIDPQMQIHGRFVSAQSIVDQFEEAKKQVKEDPTVAPVWFPILQSIGPALLKEAENAVNYSKSIVKDWLLTRMFAEASDKEQRAQKVAEFFGNTSVHLSHGRRIGKEEARSNGVIVEDLESDQELQDYVLSAYHLITILFEKSPATKIIQSNHNRQWIKNWIPVKKGQ